MLKTAEVIPASDTDAEKNIAKTLKEFNPGETAIAALREHYGARKDALNAILLIMRNIARKHAMRRKMNGQVTIH